MLSSFCILALFIFLLLLFVEPLRNEATVERGIKDVTHTKKRTRNILHFPFCILYFWLPYFPGRTFVLQTFLIQDCCNIFPQSFLSVYSLVSPSLPPTPIPPKRVAMLSSLRFPVCNKPKVIKHVIISKLHVKIIHTTLHGLIIV